jgi:hypothetical protein
MAALIYKGIYVLPPQNGKFLDLLCKYEFLKNTMHSAGWFIICETDCTGSG